MLSKFLTWWDKVSDLRATPTKTGQLKQYADIYKGTLVPGRYVWVSSRLGVHRIFRAPSESYACTECGSEISRSLAVDGIKAHEEWHWRVGQSLG